MASSVIISSLNFVQQNLMSTKMKLALMVIRRRRLVKKGTSKYAGICHIFRYHIPHIEVILEKVLQLNSELGLVL